MELIARVLQVLKTLLYKLFKHGSVCEKPNCVCVKNHYNVCKEPIVECVKNQRHVCKKPIKTCVKHH